MVGHPPAALQQAGRAVAPFEGCVVTRAAVMPETVTPPPGDRIFVALGGNQGDAPQAMRDALRALSALPNTTIVATSALYRSKPVQAQGDDFVNAVVELRSALAPESLLAHMLRIERDLGRRRPAKQSALHAARPIDLDLLMVGHVLHQSPTLTLPHPRLHERAFVLAPLADLAPQLVLAQAQGKTVAQSLATLGPCSDVVQVVGAAAWSASLMLHLS
jgi:2-amino-4-hydroxy-6-hydroxymethyldihydropteridine diphosphokinase